MPRSFSNLYSNLTSRNCKSGEDFWSVAHTAQAASQPQNAGDASRVSYLPSDQQLENTSSHLIYSAPVPQNSRMRMGHDLDLASISIKFFSLTTIDRSLAARNQN